MGLVHFEDGKVLYYPYTPSEAAGYAFMAFFAVATALHTVQMFRYRTWYFIPVLLGGICETFGYYGRAWGGREPLHPGPFMLQLMLILVAPVFVAATMYVTLGKYQQKLFGQIPRRCGPTPVFIVTDIIAFCTQIGGGLVQVTGDLKIMDIGDRVVLGGLAFQLVVMAIFLVLVVLAIRQYKTEAVFRTTGAQARLWLLAGTVVAIWVRNLVRVIEFAQGFHGFISENEAMLYVFDAAIMLSILVAWGVLHPGYLIRYGGGDVKLGKYLLETDTTSVSLGNLHRQTSEATKPRLCNA